METANNAATNKIALSPRFKGEVLRQIYRVWLMRRFIPVLLIEIAVLTLVLYQLARFIFLQRVAENAMNVFFSHPSGIIGFFASAFFNASPATKMLVISFAALTAILVRHITQGILRFILVKQNYFGRIEKRPETGDER